MKKFRISVRWSLVLATLLWASLPLAAQEKQNCQLAQGRDWQSLGVMTFSACAVEIAAAGAKSNQAEFYGAWRGTVVLVKNNGTVYWGPSRERIGQLPDPDSDGILYEACPYAAETRNEVFDNDGCPDTVNDLLTVAASDLQEFWSQEFRRNGWRYQGPSTIRPYTRQALARTGCGPAVPNNAFYCPADNGIYYDFNWMENRLLVGDFAPVTILAHEWGHLVQNLVGRNKGNSLSLATELQADCLAGAYTGYLARGESKLARLEEGDLEEGGEQTFKAGNPNEDWFSPEAHGTPEQRLRAFAIGIKNGAKGCF